MNLKDKKTSDEKLDCLIAFFEKETDNYRELYKQISNKTGLHNMCLISELLDMGLITDAIRELYFTTDSDCFSSKLFNLFCKADRNNFRKLSSAFPEYAVAYCLWYFSKNQSEFFKRHWGDRS